MEQRWSNFVRNLFSAQIVHHVLLGNPRGARLTWRLDLDNGASVVAKLSPPSSPAWMEPRLQATLAGLGAPVPPVLGISTDNQLLVMEYSKWPTYGTMLASDSGNRQGENDSSSDCHAMHLAGKVAIALHTLEQICAQNSACLQQYVAKTAVAEDMYSMTSGLARFLQARLKAVGHDVLLQDYWEPLVNAALTGPLTLGAADYHAGNVLVEPSPVKVIELQQEHRHPQVVFLDWPYLSMDYPERRLVQYLSSPPLYSGIGPEVVHTWECLEPGGAAKLAAHFRIYWGLVVSRLWVAATQPDTPAAKSIYTAWGDPIELLPLAIASWRKPLQEPIADHLIPLLDLVFGNLPI